MSAAYFAERSSRNKHQWGLVCSSTKTTAFQGLLTFVHMWGRPGDPRVPAFFIAAAVCRRSCRFMDSVP